MATLTVRTDAQTDQALKDLTADGTSQSEVIRRAVHQAWRDQQHAVLREESERLRNDPDDVAEMRAIRADLDAISAW